jgi:hypothetical protein
MLSSSLVIGYSFYIASLGMAVVALAFTLMCGFFAYNDFKRFFMKKEEKAPEVSIPEQDSINSEDSL